MGNCCASSQPEPQLNLLPPEPLPKSAIQWDISPEAMIAKLKKEIDDKNAKINELQKICKVNELEGSHSVSQRLAELEHQNRMLRDKNFMGLELIVRMAAEIEGLRTRYAEKVDEKGRVI